MYAGKTAESTEYGREWQYRVINTQTESFRSGDWGTVSWREGMDPGHWGSDFAWQAALCDLGWFRLSFSCLNILVEDSVEPSEIPGSSTPVYGFYFLSSTILIRPVLASAPAKTLRLPQRCMFLGSWFSLLVPTQLWTFRTTGGAVGEACYKQSLHFFIQPKR